MEMIYDCFSFFNELDLLEIRLNVLKDVVDKFVLVEAGETHAGNPKPLYFEQNKDRFSQFLGRIEHIKIEHFPDGCKTAWWRENLQRNAIAQGLKNATDDDVILISDLDEIPRPEKILEFKDIPGVKIFRQKYYAFYVNYLNVRWRHWGGTRMLSYRDFKNAYDGVRYYENEFLIPELNIGTTASKIRARDLPYSRGGTHEVANGGWHFTSLGGVEAVAKKMASFAHQEYNTDSKCNLDAITKAIELGQGVFWKMNCYGVELDDSFPRYILDNKERYQHLIFNCTPDYMKRTRSGRFFHTFQGYIIQLGEMICPNVVHNALHLLKRYIRGDN